MSGKGACARRGNLQLPACPQCGKRLAFELRASGEIWCSCGFKAADAVAFTRASDAAALAANRHARPCCGQTPQGRPNGARICLTCGRRATSVSAWNADALASTETNERTKE